MAQDNCTRISLYFFILLFLTATTAIPALSQTIQLPQTGQTKCYNTSGKVIKCSGTGQDGEIRAGSSWPSPRFIPGTGDEEDCITDTLSGLMWARNANIPNDDRNWSASIDYANSLVLCGHSDWRLPNVNELQTLFNSAETDNATWLSDQQFTSVMSDFTDYYWSSTTQSYWTYYAYTMHSAVGFNNMETKQDSSMAMRTWPVRGSSHTPTAVWKTGQQTSYWPGDDGALQMGVDWPDPRFTVAGDCVTDNLTGLMWARNANLPGELVTWSEALDFANNLNLCGYSSWRLPNRTELWSLIDNSKTFPPLPLNHPFTNVQSDRYWTSTTFASDPTDAWVVYLWGSFVSHNIKTESDHYYAWPVRGGLVNLCPGQYAHISGKTGYYTTIQAAYDAANNSQIVQLLEMEFNENVAFDRDIDFSLQGGYECGFSSYPGLTKLHGRLTITKGTVQVDKIIIR
jgi:hypothetical protein